MYWQEGRTLAAVLEGVAFILLLFLGVVLHEYGHALTARRYGIKTRDITLYPIGGVARLERMPDQPIQELWVALAGPFVSAAIAAVLFVFLSVTGALVPLTQLTLTGGSFLERLMLVNLVLALFNMIPAFPMDGGRALRALLALRLEYVQATQIAASIGQGLAFLFGFWGLFNNPMLLFIAFFVWMGAAQEASMVQMKSALGGIPVTRAMLTNYEALQPSDPLARAVQLMLAGTQHEFPVLEADRMTGIVTRDALVRGLTQLGQQAPVSQIMHRDPPSVDSHEMIDSALLRLQESGLSILPVVHNDQIVGIITTENITEYLMVRSALRSARSMPVRA